VTDFNSYLWVKNPTLSSEPVEIIRHTQHIDGDYLFECAALKLENGNYLFIKYTTDNINDDELGVVDYEEVDNEQAVIELYSEMVVENE